MTLRLLSLLPVASLSFLAACSSSTSVTPGAGAPDAGGGDTPPDAPPACTDDVQREEVTALTLPGPYQGPTPLVEATADADGVAALWFDGVSALRFRRWGLDGAPLVGEKTVASKLDLPGGDAALSSIAIGHAGDGYLVAFESAGQKSLLTTHVGADGAASAPQTVKTYKSGDVPSVPRVHGRDAAFFLTWTEHDPSVYDPQGAPFAQAFGLDGAPSSAVAYPGGLIDANAIDADVADGRFKIVHYRQGTGSVADRNAVLRQANTPNGDAKTWTDTVLDLPRAKTGDTSRYAPSIVSIPGGTLFVDVASYADSGETVRRIEIAELDDLGAVKKNRSIDLPADRGYVTNPSVARDGNVVYVVWADARSATDGATAKIHAWALDLDAGTTKTADANLSLAKGQGYFDDLTSPLGGAFAKGSAVTVGYVWASSDANDKRTRHVAVQSFCFATR